MSGSVAACWSGWWIDAGARSALGYANGRLETVTDRYNRSLTLVYQGSRLWKVVDFTGRA